MLAVLGLAAFVTAILSAVVGMAGGIVLLAVMLLYLPPLVAIPLHGVVQLVSNSARTTAQRSHVDTGVVWRFGLLLLPASFAGLGLAQSLSPDVARFLIGVFVLLATWLPGALRLDTGARTGRAHMIPLGAAVGFLSPTIGATGPLQAPFFLHLGLDRRGLVGSKAACQALQHLAKIAVFGVAGFAFAPWLPLLALLCLAVVAGTWVGTQLLEHVSERGFVLLYRGVLTLIALRLLTESALALL